MGTRIEWISWQKGMTLVPIKKIIEEPNPTMRQSLTREWREAKLAELNYVGLTVSCILQPLAIYLKPN